MIVLDAGALIVLDKGTDRFFAALVNELGATDEATTEENPVLIPAGAVAQVWRDGSRQARLARLLDRCGTASFDDVAKDAGVLCGKARTSDVVDASVALVAARPVVRDLYTSDPDDMTLLLEVNGRHRPKVVPVH